MRFNFQLVDTAKHFFVHCMGIIEHDGKILLVQDASKRYYGRWTLPMAETKVNEPLTSTAERGIAEATNIRARVHKVVAINQQYDDQTHTGQILIIFAMKDAQGELTVVPNKTLNASWFSYNQIFRMPEESFRFPSIRMVIKQYRKGHFYPLEMIQTV